ncbi:MAG TPA: CHAT domain-containing protein [Ktedonobacterales bacterium]|nr:CHAT domain-containing protein [Ktedonobacterales bacterium]
MQYLDFDLEIGAGSGQTYPVAIIRSPAGEAHGTLRFPFDEEALKERLDQVQTALGSTGQARRQAAQAVQAFGQSLFEALFTGDIRSCYDVSLREAARQDDRGLRVKLRIQSPELAALPWEFLYDMRQGEYVCLSRQTPIVRYLELSQSAQALPVKPPLKILCMIASPSDQDALDVQREQGRVREALKDLMADGLVELTWLGGQTWRDLQRAMRGGPWHIFHFIGHGGVDPNEGEGLLALADEEGRTHLMTATQMAHLLADHRSLRLALLNACEGAQGNERDLFSSTAATLARHGIPAVLAMQYEISDRAAIECTRSFYEALADNLPVDAAVSEARKAISLEIANTLEWATPVLYMRSSEGALFEIEQKSASQPEPVQRTQTPAAVAVAPKSEMGTLLCTYAGHDNQVFHIGWSPDGARMASVQRFDNVVHVWDTDVGARLFTYEGHTDYVASVAWSPDNTRIASASWDGTIHIWEAQDGGKLLLTYKGHEGRVLDVAWSPDGKRIASVGQNEQVHIWGAASGALITSWPGQSPLAWSPDGVHVACRSGESNARIYAAAKGTYLFGLDFPEVFYALAWSPDGNLIASAGEGGVIRLWKSIGGGQWSFSESEETVMALAWSADSKRLASCGYDGFVHIWDADSLKNLFTYKGHEGDTVVTDVAWSTDGTRIASASWDETVHIWQAE